MQKLQIVIFISTIISHVGIVRPYVRHRWTTEPYEFLKKGFLPGQFSGQSVISSECPRHCWPPNAGAGFVHVLERFLRANTHWGHGLQSVHSDHPPSTGEGARSEHKTETITSLYSSYERRFFHTIVYARYIAINFQFRQVSFILPVHFKEIRNMIVKYFLPWL